MYRTNVTQNDRYFSPNEYRDQNNSVFFSMLPENLCFVLLFFFSFRWQEFTQSDNFLVSPIFSKLLRQEFSRIEFYYSPINLIFQKIPYSPVLHQSMAEKRLSTLKIKYNDKTHWLAQRKYQSFNISSPMLLKKKENNEVITLQLVIQTKLFKQSWHSSIFSPLVK